MALALFAWLLAIAGTVLAHYGFTLSRDGEFLYVKRGLLERREATIPLGRIAERYGTRIGPIEHQPWRMRDFVLFDPSGVLWRIGQNVPATPG